MRALLLISMAMILGLPFQLYAAVGAESSIGSNTQIIKVNGDGEFDKNWNWNTEISEQQATSEDPTTGASITDQTTDVNGGIGWESADHVALGGGLDYSVTPKERLTNFGPNVDVGWTFNLSHASKRNHFVPKMNLKASVGLLTMTERFNGSVATKTGTQRPVSGSLSLRQTSTSVSAKIHPWSIFAAKLSHTTYRYDRDVTTFLNNLDTRFAGNIGASGFASTVNGLPKTATSLTLYYYINDDWELDLEETVTISIVDDSRENASKALVYYMLNEDWEVGLGDEIDKAPSINDNLVTASLHYDF